MIDNKIVQFALVFLAFYIIVQMMNKDQTSEYMDSLDTVVSVKPQLDAPAQITIDQVPHSGIERPAWAPVNSLLTTQQTGTSAASASGIATSVPSAAITGQGNTPSPLSATGETLLATAPAVTAEDEKIARTNQNLFAPEPTDIDALFSRGRSQLDPSELIPKVQDAELYGDIPPDPKFNQSFLQNRWSMGIDVSKSKGQSINDLRGAPPSPPMKIISPFQQPTVVPDYQRKTLGEIS